MSVLRRLGRASRLASDSEAESQRVAAAGRIEPAELLYGRLLASVAGGAEPGDARVRIADGRAQKLPLARWLAPVDAADRAVLARAVAPGARHRLRSRPPPRGARRRRAARASAWTSPPSRCGSPAPGAPRRSCAPSSPTSRAPARGGPRCCSTATSASAARRRRCSPAPARSSRPAARCWSRPARRTTPTRRVRVRLETHGAVSPWFGWATVGARGIAPLARAAGLRAAGDVRGGRALVRAAGAPAVNAAAGAVPAGLLEVPAARHLAHVDARLDPARARRCSSRSPASSPTPPTSPISGATRWSTRTSRSRRSSTGRPGRRGCTRSRRACT